MGFGGIGGFAGDVLGGVTSVLAPPVAQYLGQQEANEMNRQAASHAFSQSQSSAREAMAFEADQAKQQMAFQERMSSTAYQRATDDLKKAGLNPLMALTNNASSPSGAAGGGAQATASAPELGSPAQAAATSTVESAKALSSVLSSVMQAKMFGAQSANLEASTANLRASAHKQGIEADVMRRDEVKGEVGSDINKIYKWIRNNAVQNFKSSAKDNDSQKAYERRGRVRGNGRISDDYINSKQMDWSPLP